jgi:hypothetical protein
MNWDEPVAAPEENAGAPTDSNEEFESAFAWEWRAMAVSAVWMVPGSLLGALVRLCVPEGGPAEWWLIGGGILGAIAGGMLEADYWP